MVRSCARGGAVDGPDAIDYTVREVQDAGAASDEVILNIPG